MKSQETKQEESMQDIKIITLSLPYKLGTVNCYLVETDTGFVLIDTGSSNRRTELENQLASASCKPGNLKLIVLTHGDFDHTGNAAYLRDKFGAKIAMHKDDAGMAEHGDMFWNRSSGNTLFSLIAPILFRFPKSNRFRSDFCIEEGDDFSEYGFDAQVLSIPGHSKGSIGILTAGGDLFCGDLLENSRQPAANSIMDDSAACDASLGKLQAFEINTVYPGHGKPFAMDSFLTNHRENNAEDDMDRQVVVAYAAKYGATAEITEKIGQVLCQAGLRVDVLPTDAALNRSDLSAYEAMVMGSAVYIGQWRKEAVRF